MCPISLERNKQKNTVTVLQIIYPSIIITYSKMMLYDYSMTAELSEPTGKCEAVLEIKTNDGLFG